MTAVVHALMAAVGEATSSPLSVESTYAELMRLAQLAFFAGIAWILKEVKNTRKTSSETHNEIQQQITDVRNLAQKNFQTNHDAIEEMKDHLEKRFDELEKSI